jgi:hypothetical protein
MEKPAGGGGIRSYERFSAFHEALVCGESFHDCVFTLTGLYLYVCFGWKESLKRRFKSSSATLVSLRCKILCLCRSTSKQDFSRRKECQYKCLDIPWRWRQQGPPIRWYLPTRLWSVAFQKKVIFMPDSFQFQFGGPFGGNVMKCVLYRPVPLSCWISLL